MRPEEAFAVHLKRPTIAGCEAEVVIARRLSGFASHLASFLLTGQEPVLPLIQNTSEG
jgi:hypothetical protein